VQTHGAFDALARDTSSAHAAENAILRAVAIISVEV